MGLVLYTLNFGLHTENGNINVCVCVFVRVLAQRKGGVGFEWVTFASLGVVPS